MANKIDRYAGVALLSAVIFVICAIWTNHILVSIAVSAAAMFLLRALWMRRGAADARSARKARARKARGLADALWTMEDADAEACIRAHLNAVYPESIDAAILYFPACAADASLSVRAVVKRVRSVSGRALCATGGAFHPRTREYLIASRRAQVVLLDRDKLARIFDESGLAIAQAQMPDAKKFHFTLDRKRAKTLLGYALWTMLLYILTGQTIYLIVSLAAAAPGFFALYKYRDRCALFDETR